MCYKVYMIEQGVTMTDLRNDIFYKDSCRRDFTINSLLMTRNGKIIDFHNGQEDLENGVLKFIGNPEERIKEDALRIMRFFRFLSKFENFDKTTIDKPSLDACVKHKGLLKNISVERIKMELFKIFEGNHNKEIMDLMSEVGVADIIGISNVDTSLLKRLRYQSGNPMTMFVSLAFKEIMYMKCSSNDKALNVSIPKYQSEKWKFSNGERGLFQNILSFQSIIKCEDDLKKILTRRVVPEWHLKEFAYIIDNEDYVDIIISWHSPYFPISGQDLLDKGIKQDREFGDKLQQLRKIWEDSGFVISKEELMDKV